MRGVAEVGHSMQVESDVLMLFFFVKVSSVGDLGYVDIGVCRFPRADAQQNAMPSFVRLASATRVESDCSTYIRNCGRPLFTVFLCDIPYSFFFNDE